MTYFLDFDRTLFDTDAYYLYLLEKPAVASIRAQLASVIASKRDQTLTGGSERVDVWDQVSALIHDGTLAFTPGELSQFVYEDAFDRLATIGKDTVILTFGEKERQRVKVESGLANTSVQAVHYLEEGTKAEFLRSLETDISSDALFVDDRPVELEAMSVAFPNIALYEMRRDEKAGDGRWPVVRSLTELP